MYKASDVFYHGLVNQYRICATDENGYVPFVVVTFSSSVMTFNPILPKSNTKVATSGSGTTPHLNVLPQF
jgi:hypothetical protein